MASRGPLPSSFDKDDDFYNENRLAKLGRRLKEEPLIPLGCLLTCVALYKATRSIRRGDKDTTNRMFRARIYAQGFTLLAMVGGSYYYQKERDERKGKEAEHAAKKALEKRDAWIKELEIRDQEDRELRERAKKLAERRREARGAVTAAVEEHKTAQAEKNVAEAAATAAKDAKTEP